MGTLKRLSALLLALSFPALLGAASRFALYFNSDGTRITTVIIYNESETPLALGLNAEIDWENAESVVGGEPATLLVPGDLISLRQEFLTGDLITIESESDGLSLSLTSDRDSVYVYARESLDKGRVIKED